MDNNRIFKPIFILLSLFFGVSGSAYGWAQTKTIETGLPIFWKGNCASYTLVEQSIDNSHHYNGPQPLVRFEEVQEAVRASFETWENVPCSYFNFLETEPSHCIDIGFHQKDGNANRIYFLTEGWMDLESPWRTYEQLALTSVFYKPKTGEILDADIELNGEDYNFTTVFHNPDADIQNVLTHEIGHFFGLDHSDHEEATMYLSAASGELGKRDLFSDDIEGVCSIYPIDKDPQRCFDNYGGLDLECETAQWCEEPVDGITPFCTFSELVCCCEEYFEFQGDPGPCDWKSATECFHIGWFTHVDNQRCGPMPQIEKECGCRTPGFDTVNRFFTTFLSIFFL